MAVRVLIVALVLLGGCGGFLGRETTCSYLPELGGWRTCAQFSVVGRCVNYGGSCEPGSGSFGDPLWKERTRFSRSSTPRPIASDPAPTPASERDPTGS